MPVTAADILHYKSADGDSEGGAISGSTITSGVMNNLWPDITDAERVAGITLYRKTFWKNIDGSESMLVPVIYVPDPPDNAAFHIGLGFDHADDDNSAQGNMTAWTADALVALISDGSDTRVVTIVGVDDTDTPISEDVTLTGAVEVLSIATFRKVWGWRVASGSGTRTVLLKQGSGGTTRGTIGTNEIASWLWATATSKGAGIELPDIAPSQNRGVWHRLVVSAGATATRPNTMTTRIEENA
jgi:hypothetical protein